MDSSYDQVPKLAVMKGNYRILPSLRSSPNDARRLRELLLQIGRVAERYTESPTGHFQFTGDLRLFTRAIVRIPGSNFADGLTTVDLGTPHFDEVLAQHVQYCDALRQCGLDLTTLEPDLRHPDSTFVEDAAILTPHAAILTRPGAASREGEVAAIRPVIERFYSRTLTIDAPGTVDGGDICEAEDHFFIGVSLRTNEEGARQLAAHLAANGYTASTIDIRSMTTILHLKSGISYIGDNTLIVMERWPRTRSSPASIRSVSLRPKAIAPTVSA